MPLKLNVTFLIPTARSPGTYSVIRSTSAKDSWGQFLNLFNRENRFGCGWGNGIRLMLSSVGESVELTLIKVDMDKFNFRSSVGDLDFGF